MRPSGSFTLSGWRAVVFFYGPWLIGLGTVVDWIKEALS